MAARIPTRRTIAAVLATTTATLLLGACGDQTEAGRSAAAGGGGGAGGAKSDAPLFATLPADIQRAGVKVGTDATYAPMEFTENGKILRAPGRSPRRTSTPAPDPHAPRKGRRSDRHHRHMSRRGGARCGGV
ncbi:hypothetical protein ACFVT6_02875 [Streptomyces sp. NPDC058049]|uniref:hypothetical protein n=1 Tax=Streptomyces sp. NPDC058049 TaxID=3346314 RepID=UPI0036E14B21